MKLAIRCIIFTFILLNSTSIFANEKSLDKIVAIVNDELVSKSELNQTLTTVRSQFKHEQIAEPADLNNQVLEQLINKKLQLQLAGQANVTVTEEEMSKAIQNIAKQNNMTEAAFYSRLKQEGLSKNSYQKEMKDQLIIQKMQQQEVARRINVSSQEIDSYLRSRIWEGTGPKEYHLIDIVLPITDVAPKEEMALAKQKAKNVAEGLKKGVTLQALAKPLANSSYALQSEDLGFLKLTELPSIFVNEVSHMQKNDIAGPISAPNGFHILQVVDVSSSVNKQAKPTRKQVENLLLQRKYQEAIQNWISKIRSQAYIVKQL